MAPYALHVLLSKLKGKFLHPYMTREIGRFVSLPLFQEATFITYFSALFLSDNLPLLFPPAYYQVVAVIRELRPSPSSQAQSLSDLSLYAIWKYALSKEINLTPLDPWPLVPVISRGRQLLVSSCILQYLLVMAPSQAQDLSRQRLQLELDAIDTEASAAIGKECVTIDEVVAVDKEQDKDDFEFSFHTPIDMFSLQQLEVQAQTEPLLDLSEVIRDLNLPPPPSDFSPPSPPPTVPAIASASATRRHSLFPCIIYNSLTDQAEIQSDPTSVDSQLACAAYRLGLPFLDSSILEGIFPLAFSLI